MTTMTQSNTLRIFRSPMGHASAHIASDVPHWVKQFNQLCETHKEHRKSLKELYKVNDKYCKPYVFSKKNTVIPRSIELIQNDIKKLQERRRDDMRKFHEAQKAFNDIRNAFKEHAHVVESPVKLQNVYANAREALDKQSAAVDKSKKNYHNVMFKIEKASVKSKLATEPSVVYKAEKKIRHLNEKSQTFAEKYEDDLVGWRKQAEILSKVAADLEANFIEAESVRANLIIGNLVACFNNERTGLKSDDGDSDKLFRGIDGKELITDVVKKMTETIIIPVFEPYTSGATADTYASAKSDLLGDDSDEDDEDSDLDNLSDTEFKHEIQTNRRLKRLRKSQTFIVTEEYEKREPSEINLIVGERVKQLLPANGEGYSFGEVTHGKLRKKKKGFYPDSHVSLIELLESDDDDDDDDDSTRNHRKKVIKKVVARAKAKRVQPDNDNLDDESPINTEGHIRTCISDYGFSDLDDNDEDESENSKLHKKSRIKRLVAVVKPKKKDAGKSHSYDKEESIDIEEDIAEEDILNLYKKKGRVEKFVNAMITVRKSKSEHTKEDGDEKVVADVKYKKKNKMKNAMNALKGGKKEKLIETGYKTMVMHIGDNEEIRDIPEEMPKKKSKRFSKLTNIFKKSRNNDISMVVKGDNATGDQDDFQFIKRESKLCKGPINDLSQECTEVRDIDFDEEDFGYVNFIEKGLQFS